MNILEKNVSLSDMGDIFIESVSEIDSLFEDIDCLLEIIKRNEKDIKIYQDEWFAIKDMERILKDLKENRDEIY